MHIYTYTVKPVYNDHPAGQANMVAQDRWSQTAGRHESWPGTQNRLLNAFMTAHTYLVVKDSRWNQSTNNVEIRSFCYVWRIEHILINCMIGHWFDMCRMCTMTYCRNWTRFCVRSRGWTRSHAHVGSSGAPLAARNRATPRVRGGASNHGSSRKNMINFHSTRII